MYRHTGRLGGKVLESCPCGSLNFFYRWFLLSVLWPIILICLVPSPYLISLGILPCVCMHLLANWILPQRLVGRTSLNIILLWSPRNLSVHVWSGRSPHFENQKYVFWAEPSLLPQLLYSSWSFSPQGMKLQLVYHGIAHLSPASLHCLLSVISVGNPVVSPFVLLKTMGLTSLSLEFRLFSVIFKSFHYICEDVGFPLPSSFGRESEIYSASWVCGLSSLINFGNVLAISSSSVTSSLQSLLAW